MNFNTSSENASVLKYIYHSALLEPFYFVFISFHFFFIYYFYKYSSFFCFNEEYPFYRFTEHTCFYSALLPMRCARTSDFETFHPATTKLTGWHCGIEHDFQKMVKQEKDLQRRKKSFFFSLKFNEWQIRYVIATINLGLARRMQPTNLSNN